MTHPPYADLELHPADPEPVKRIQRKRTKGGDVQRKASPCPYDYVHPHRPYTGCDGREWA